MNSAVVATSLVRSANYISAYVKVCLWGRDREKLGYVLSVHNKT